MEARMPEVVKRNICLMYMVCNQVEELIKKGPDNDILKFIKKLLLENLVDPKYQDLVGGNSRGIYQIIKGSIQHSQSQALLAIERKSVQEK